MALRIGDKAPDLTAETTQGRTAATNATVRTVYLIGPDKLIKATPVNWKQGEDVIIVPAVSDDEARERFPQGWKTLKPYLRVAPQPRG